MSVLEVRSVTSGRVGPRSPPHTARRRHPETMTCDSELGVGDIVCIVGLQSAAAKPMNDKHAEVIAGVDEATGRLKVAVALPIADDVGEAHAVKSVAIKTANVHIISRAADAAMACAALPLLPALGENPHQDTFLAEAAALANQIPTLTGEAIVARLRAHDKVMVQALTLPGRPSPPPRLKDAMNQSGLASACLAHLAFPAAIDDTGDDVQTSGENTWPPIQPLTALLNTLTRDAFGSDAPAVARLRDARLAVCRRLGPSLLLASSPKQRLFGRWLHWFQLSIYLPVLVSNCLLSAECVPLMLSLDAAVVTALDTLLLRALTVPPRTAAAQSSELGRDASIGRNMFEDGGRGAATAAVRAFMELADINLVGVAGVQRIGALRVPSGAPEAGRTFASAILDISARSPAVLAQELDCLQYLYGCFCNCPPLHDTLDWDQNFPHLDPRSAAAWAAARRGTSQAAAPPSPRPESDLHDQD